MRSSSPLCIVNPALSAEQSRQYPFPGDCSMALLFRNVVARLVDIGYYLGVVGSLSATPFQSKRREATSSSPVRQRGGEEVFFAPRGKRC